MQFATFRTRFNQEAEKSWNEYSSSGSEIQVPRSVTDSSRKSENPSSIQFLGPGESLKRIFRVRSFCPLIGGKNKSFKTLSGCGSLRHGEAPANPTASELALDVPTGATSAANATGAPTGRSCSEASAADLRCIRKCWIKRSSSVHPLLSNFLATAWDRTPCLSNVQIQTTLSTVTVSLHGRSPGVVVSVPSGPSYDGSHLTRSRPSESARSL